MGLAEQITSVIESDFRLQKDIADAAGVHACTIRKVKIDPEHIITGLLLDVLKVCGYTLTVSKIDAGQSEIIEEIVSNICDNYCKFPVSIKSEKELDYICRSCPINRL